MELYFTPLSCAMATRICLYEAGAQATFVEVDAKTKRTEAGDDYHAINQLGQVPSLRLEDGAILSENAAVLQYVARRFAGAQLAPRDDAGIAHLQQWLCFIGTELHKALFTPVLDRNAPQEVKRFALEKGKARLTMLDSYLSGREYLLEGFSVADAYLVTVLNWTAVTPLELASWPALHAYHKRLRTRPSVAKAMAEELTLYQAQQARHQEIGAVAVATPFGVTTTDF
jgi:glutathione S-transferase